MDEPKIVETLLPSVKYAGQEIIKIYKLKPTRLIKNDGSPVTIADKETEEIIRDKIRKSFPTHGILGEEYESENLDSEFIWVIDPKAVILLFMMFNILHGHQECLHI